MKVATTTTLLSAPVAVLSGPVAVLSAFSASIMWVAAREEREAPVGATGTWGAD